MAVTIGGEGRAWRHRGYRVCGLDRGFMGYLEGERVGGRENIWAFEGWSKIWLHASNGEEK